MKLLLFFFFLLPAFGDEILEVFAIEVNRKFIRPTYEQTVGKDQETVLKTLESLRKLAKTELANIIIDSRLNENKGRSQTRDEKYQAATFAHAPAGAQTGYSIEWWSSVDFEARRRVQIKRARENPDKRGSQIYESFDFSFYHQPTVGWAIAAIVQTEEGAIFLFENRTPDVDSIMSKKSPGMMVGSLSMEVPNEIENDNIVRTLEDDDRIHVVMIRQPEGTLSATMNYKASFCSEVPQGFKPTNLKFTFLPARLSGFGKPLLPGVQLSMNRLAKIEAMSAQRHRDKFSLDFASDYASTNLQPHVVLEKMSGDRIRTESSKKVGPKYYFDGAMFDFQVGPKDRS